jgi:hypothetical protein
VFNLIDPSGRQDIHLFCINVNTRYLVCYPLRSKSAEEIGRALEHFINNYPVSYLRGDGERAFGNLILNKWLEDNDIKIYINSSKFTYHNKIVDVVVKTIRNAIAYRMISEAQLQKIIEYYNHTYHKSIDCAPFEMQFEEDHEKEDQYIRYCTQRLLQVKQRQEFEGLLSYERGNILLLHCDLSKTS